MKLKIWNIWHLKHTTYNTYLNNRHPPASLAVLASREHVFTDHTLQWSLRMPETRAQGLEASSKVAGCWAAWLRHQCPSWHSGTSGYCTDTVCADWVDLWADHETSLSTSCSRCHDNTPRGHLVLTLPRPG